MAAGGSWRVCVTTAEEFRDKARQCRRLVWGISDTSARAGLNKLAEECDAKAVAVEARTFERAYDKTAGKL